MEQIIHKAILRGQKTLSEYDSKLVIQSVGIPITREKLALSRDESARYAEEIGFPVVLKGCSDKTAHKTEMGLVKLNLSDAAEVKAAYDDITGMGQELDGVLVQEMIHGNRELVIGMIRDPQFGPCVMFGIGGVFTEVLKDVSFRVAPLTELDALEMIDEIRMRKILDEFRGSPAVDLKELARALVGIGEIGYRHDEIAEIDINPVIISGSGPVVVDALVVLARPN